MNEPQQQQQHQQEVKQPPSSQTKPMSFSTPPQMPSTSSTYHHTKTPKTTEIKSQKLCNTSALLDQYQDDDDLTTNLLHAIRSWNLQRPPDAESTSPPTNIHNNGSSSSSSPLMNQKNDNHDCNSTINTVNSDLDTATFSAISISSTCSTLTSTHHNQHQQQQQQQQNMHSQQQSSNSSTITNGSTPSVTSNSTIHSNSAVKKTPCRGNYSSRPSGLTARILLETENNNHDDIVESPLVCNPSSSSRNDMGNEVGDCDNSRGESTIMDKQNSTNTTTYPMSPQQEEKQEPPTIQSTPTTKNTFIKRNDNDYPTQINAIEILQEAALTLGLNPQTDLQKVLPTIQKLARVVMVHVPNMEQFVDEVCNLVLSHSQQSSISTSSSSSDNVPNHNQHQETIVKDEMISESEFETEDEEQRSDFQKIRRKQTKKKKKKKRSTTAKTIGGTKKSKSKKTKRKNIQARKEQMDHVVNLLKQEWQPKKENNPHTTNYSSDGLCTPTSTGASSRRALQKVNVNNFDSWDTNTNTSTARSVEDNMIRKTNTLNNKSCSGNDDDSNNHYESFYNNVMKKLEQSHPCNIEKAKESSQSEQEQALAIITNLIQFEQRYGKVHGRTNQQTNTTPSPSSNNFNSIIQSPPQSNDIVNNLFQVEASTLRHYAYHFTYLFSVSQEEIMEKMNDLYVFNHEASTMINELKGMLGLDVNCPMKKVGKAVVDVLRANGYSFVNEEKVDVTIHNKDQKQQQQVSGSNLRREQPILMGTLKQKDQEGEQQSHHQYHQQQQQQQRVRFNVVVEEFS